MINKRTLMKKLKNNKKLFKEKPTKTEDIIKPELKILIDQVIVSLQYDDFSYSDLKLIIDLVAYKSNFLKDMFYNKDNVFYGIDTRKVKSLKFEEMLSSKKITYNVYIVISDSFLFLSTQKPFISNLIDPCFFELNKTDREYFLNELNEMLDDKIEKLKESNYEK